jgi:hypothetical protein
MTQPTPTNPAKGEAISWTVEERTTVRLELTVAEYQPGRTRYRAATPADLEAAGWTPRAMVEIMRQSCEETVRQRDAAQSRAEELEAELVKSLKEVPTAVLEAAGLFKCREDILSTRNRRTAELEEKLTAAQSRAEELEAELSKRQREMGEALGMMHEPDSGPTVAQVLMDLRVDG